MTSAHQPQRPVVQTPLNTTPTPTPTPAIRPTRPPLHALLALGLVLLCSPAWAQLELNQAREADLDSLKGVGPALTARILAQRSQAPFADWPDLMRRVKGIRTATARRLAGQGVTVNGQTLTAEPPASPKTD